MSVPAPTAAEILGANLKAEWDARVGVSGVTWTDSVSGRVLTGVGTPTFGTDGASFSGLPVWKLVAASTQYLAEAAGQPAIIAGGSTDFYCSMVVRATNLSTGAAMQLLDMCDSGITAESMNMGINAAGTSLLARFGPFLVDGGAPDTTPH